MRKSKFEKFLWEIQQFDNWTYVISAEIHIQEFYEQFIAESHDNENITFEEFEKWVVVDYVRFQWWLVDYDFQNWWRLQQGGKPWAKKVLTY